MKAIYDAYTEKGPVREINQDSIYAYHDEEEGMYLFCVADGMGGHEQGEKASGHIADAMKAWTDVFYSSKYDGRFDSVVRDLGDALNGANKYIFDNYNQDGSVCGSTIVMLIIYGDKYAVYHLGDSRVYRRSGMRKECLTKDDTWENEPANASKYTREDIVKRPEYGKLVRAVGVHEVSYPHLQTGRIKPGEVFLLCSDGIYKPCTMKDIGIYMGKARKAADMEALRKEFIKSVYAKGVSDNLSCITVRIMK